MNGPLPLWVEVPVVLLLVMSGVFTLAAAVGVLRFKSFFQRLHTPALASSCAAWCVALATTLYFSAQQGGLALHAGLIIIFLSLTVPITTLLLARTELFRQRVNPRSVGEVPPPLSGLLPPEERG